MNKNKFKIYVFSVILLSLPTFSNLTLASEVTGDTVNGIVIVTPNVGGSNYIATTPATVKKGDANGDNKIDKYDFSLMIANWGKTGTNTCDFNNNGKVDKYDFALLMLNWSI